MQAIKQAQQENSGVVTRSGPEGGSTVGLKFYTSWTSWLQTIVTK